jgi:hypothetical protein
LHSPEKKGQKGLTVCNFPNEIRSIQWNHPLLRTHVMSASPAALACAFSGWRLVTSTSISRFGKGARHGKPEAVISTRDKGKTAIKLKDIERHAFVFSC